ncbi:GDP-mannose 4,6-dehydratase [Oxalobacter formigenes]|nr:GDP-mannose 4,6-dehydratase [Oxalobacter formigenes]
MSCFSQKYPDCYIINLDKLMDAGNPENLMECKSMTNIVFNNDICHETGIDSVFEKLDIQEVRFTAESCVDNSVKDPKTFIETNVVGA